MNLAPGLLVEQASGLDAAFEAERNTAGELRMITRRQVKTHNSWTHNHELTGIPVEVRPAAGAPDPSSWSGIA